ncbi:apolipoprotein N-acyltransferase [Chthonomonas calidirosea]|uniref:apolipoprotein N-acyltransferase n=1 Tax=Chthonomonas calidirosea TaxID=454171 RepID=UPI0006EC6195|nr:apolipoprotein N-acyltransferase [Chthonomonas calidirosea]CEK15311.1 Apolipoprotein N-acyltransferase [Chthonomonas calidirosea]
MIAEEIGSKTEPTRTVPPRTPWGLRLALLSGLLLWLANPPAGLWPLAWVALAPLVVSVLRARHFAQATWRGYLFGWAFLGPLWYWIGLTISAWTGSAIGWIAWFGLTFILAGFFALWAGVAWWLDRNVPEQWAVTALAAAWVVMEWARTLGPLSMPWAQLSYTQYRFLPILQIADFTGAYGVSFLMMLVNAALAYFWMGRDQPLRPRRLWAACTLSVMVCLYGLARLQQHDVGPSLQVADLQTNVSSYQAPSPATQLQIMNHLAMKAKAHAPAPQLYVFPESASPYDPIQNPSGYLFFQQLAKTTNAAILTGAEIYAMGADHNAAVLFAPELAHPQVYFKQQLVPFGEFIPFRSLLSPLFGRLFNFPTTDLTPGRHGRPLQTTLSNGVSLTIGPFICYESMYPARVRSFTRRGASLLVTISNDSWFLSRAAMQQHLAAVVLRAIENRRQVVRSTTTGITCMIDAEGHLLARLPINQEGFLVHPMRLLHGQTPYVRFGDWFVGLCALLLGGLFIVQTWKRKAHQP